MAEFSSKGKTRCKLRVKYSNSACCHCAAVCKQTEKKMHKTLQKPFRSWFICRPRSYKLPHTTRDAYLKNIFFPFEFPYMTHSIEFEYHWDLFISRDLYDFSWCRTTNIRSGDEHQKRAFIFSVARKRVEMQFRLFRGGCKYEEPLDIPKCGIFYKNRTLRIRMYRPFKWKRHYHCTIDLLLLQIRMEKSCLYVPADCLSYQWDIQIYFPVPCPIDIHEQCAFKSKQPQPFKKHPTHFHSILWFYYIFGCRFFPIFCVYDLCVVHGADVG